MEPGREVEPGSSLSFWPDRPRAEKSGRRLRVLYEDRHVLIVDKPAGMLTQPTPARERGTLLEHAGRYLARKRRIERPYVGIVQRLDRDTSGSIVLVCSSRALRPFQALFRAHAVERTYFALVEGAVAPARGTIDLPLVADRGDGRKGVARVAGQGTDAVTHYEVVEAFGRRATWLACRLETGRTHQIRIHLADIGHPIIGDPVYRPASRPQLEVPFGRQALHACSVGFVHPLTKEPIRAESPLPDDLTALIKSLRQGIGQGKRGYVQ
jgi:23S rRNA pseudouridine1911/1915/1917 synthase